VRLADREEASGMRRDELRRVSLCHTDKCCPEVVVDAARGQVRIGEDGNLVVLDRRYWNELVEQIQSGELTRL